MQIMEYIMCATDPSGIMTLIGCCTISRNSMYIGKTTPWQGSVTVVSRDYFDDIPVFKIQVSRGFRNKNTKMTSMDTSKILDGLYAFGVKCGLNAPPLLYASKINTYAVLSPPSFWKNLHFTEDKHLTDTFLAYKNEYRQCFYCTDADFSALEKRVRASTIPLIRFDDISQAHVTGGFNESQRNEFVFPGSETLNQPPYGDNTVGLSIQVTDGRENETPTQQHNDLSRQMQSGAGQEQNNKHKWKTAKYPDFQDIKYRLESYRGWPLAEPNPRALCEAGFVFTGHSYDLVRCFCCGIGLKDFSDTDDPMLEHAKNSSNCPFILDHFGSLEALERYRQRIVTQDPEKIRRRQRDIFQRQLGREAANYRAKHEWFRTLQSRLDTYTHWPQHLSQSPEQLAEAGMFYTGVDDHCRCFACDGGLRKWEPGDDPWIEHCRWFPACPYAREIKGDEFINLVQLSADHALENVSNSQDEASGAMAALKIDDANIEILVEQNKDILVKDMGFSISDVKTAIFEVLQQGTTIPDIVDIITRLEVMSERKHLEEQLKQTQVPLDPEGTFPTER
ncbi:baculoviral IAP repeat-containing protein 2-like isoform X1 [Dreissena polymorpha]|uniref:baculoviral IAP repeat-containing protein 2-like isoform X1 n=3 Tax=Dreissena polymorpha TaxID=45954 RepID=UPI0022643FEF|nr:baculoviral IAP repeat-containing protein 2-like isoform X1 [Dreissena polymorpha]